jgi:virulence surface antigen
MQLQQIMESTAKKYGADFYLFDQAQFPWNEQVAKGVCHALCKIWLKRFSESTDKDFYSYVQGNKAAIEAKQLRSMDRKYASTRLLTPVTVSETHNNHREGFWAALAEEMMLVPKFNGKIGSLHFRGKDSAHAIAICSESAGCRLFDPNGGIMDFNGSEENMEKFLKKHLRLAQGLSYNYGDVYCIKISEFQPKDDSDS